MDNTIKKIIKWLNTIVGSVVAAIIASIIVGSNDKLLEKILAIVVCIILGVCCIIINSPATKPLILRFFANISVGGIKQKKGKILLIFFVFFGIIVIGSIIIPSLSRKLSSNFTVVATLNNTSEPIYRLSPAPKPSSTFTSTPTSTPKSVLTPVLVATPKPVPEPISKSKSVPTPVPAFTSTPASIPQPTPAPAPEPTDNIYPMWHSGISYKNGDKVVYENKIYKCIRDHLAMTQPSDLNNLGVLWTEVDK